MNLRNNMNSKFLQVMLERGFIQDCTNLTILDEILTKTPASTAYVGYDATANSLHVGHLVNIMMLRWFQKCGGRPITLMGGGTSQIGDPSFRSEERPILEIKDIQNNVKSLQKVFKKFLNYKNVNNNAIMVNNIDWLEKLEYLEFLRKYGKYFSINRMLSFDSVKSRLDRNQSLTFLEFNYMILQAFDFKELKERYNCILQIGGSDQWGNIVNGIDLTRKILKQEIYGLTSPLLTTSNGKKMGKSQNGAIWLDKDLLSPYEFWQFWRNTSDKDVTKFLLLYTELPVKDCHKLGNSDGLEINEAKIILANNVTTLCHGAIASNQAQNTSRKVFTDHKSDENLPTYLLPKKDFDDKISLVQLFVKSGLVKSGKEFKRLITGRGLRYNNAVVDSTDKSLIEKDFDPHLKLSVGKKKHMIVKIVP